jgi:D-alanine-D-alanine ligase
MNSSPRNHRNHRIRVAVVFGGRSSEHQVSCVTAGSVLAALDPSRYEIVPIGITTAGRWVLDGGDPSRLAITDGTMPHVDDAGDSVVLPAGGQLTVHVPGQIPQALGQVDVVFPLLHGPFGEDGTLQGLMELADVRYVGSGVLASAVGMDKHVMKVLLAAAGLPVARYVLVAPAAWESQRDRVLTEVSELGLPVFVKPARSGSSMGVTRVRRLEDLEAAVLAAREHDPKVLIEETIIGREVECGVLEGVGGGSPEASVVGEIRFGDHDFYDFQAKYLPGGDVSLEIPADLPANLAERVRQMAVEAFSALSCESLARVDFFVRADGSPVVNEVNTMPGFTPTSMFPMLWAKSGLDYPSLVDRLIQTALQRPLGLR